MTDVQDCCQRNGAYISFLENVCTFEVAKIYLTPLNKCLFVSVLEEDAECYRKVQYTAPVLEELTLYVQRDHILKVTE